MHPASPASPMRDRLRLPLGEWVVACKPCRGWLLDTLMMIGLERRA